DVVAPLIAWNLLFAAEPIAIRDSLEPVGEDHGAVRFGACRSISPTPYPGLNRRYCSTVTALAARANVRPIRRRCRTSFAKRSASLNGEPIVNSTGPGITTKV